MITIKVLVQGIISLILVYAPQYGLDDSQLKLQEKDIVVAAGFLNGHVGSNPENYEAQHGDYDYGVRNKKGERILEFCAGMNITVRNIPFKNVHVVTYEPDPSKTQISYCLVKNKRKFLKDVKVLSVSARVRVYQPE